MASPRGDPIVIPPTFRLESSNLSSVTRTINILLTLTGPRTERKIAQFSQTLGSGESFVRSFRSRIPGRAEAGTYTVTGTASVSGQVEASDSFDLRKQ